MPLSIITDTAANLPAAIVRENNITVIPLTYYINGTPYCCADADQFNGEEFYGAIREGAEVKTSQIPPQTYIDYMTSILETGDDILFIGLSSGVSGSFNSARIAAQQLAESFPERKIRLIDSLGASLGEGLLVLRAIECRRHRMAMDDIVERILNLRRRMYQTLTVDDLMHLKRGGRLSGAAAVVGTMLALKPILKGNDQGKIVTCDKVRGRRRAVEALAEKYVSLVEYPKNQIIGIAHADCPEDAEYLKTLVTKKFQPKSVITVPFEPVLGSHVGPGALALFFEGDNEVRQK
ncbi:MAG: DegV family protein [Ruminococcaceae bacterium]|nr:DegV family protein [Oscillospiraceae bacterium]